MLRHHIISYLQPHRQLRKPYTLTKLLLYTFTSSLPLPQPNSRNILITAALPYVNNTPHLGNIIGAILSADSYSRYCKLRGYNSILISGTDEYGTTTEVKAKLQKTSPQQICNRFNKLHKQIYDWFQIEFSYFGRTSCPEHQEITMEIFQQVYKNGYIQKQGIKEFYCQNCSISLADRYVLGNCGKCGAATKGDQCDSCNTIYSNPINELVDPKCSICSTTPIVKQTQQLYLKLSKCQPMLRKWFLPESNEGKVQESGMKNWSNNAKAVTKAWINSGIQDRCISRSLNWGVPIPQKYLEGKKVFYVWFQAPIGYISITKAALGQNWRQWWQPPQNTKVQLTQFMGKDNIPFHSIIFPSTLYSTRQPFTKVSRLSVTEYLLYEGGKFSKSNKIGIFGDDCVKTSIKSDVWRYYLLLSRPEVYDTEFLWEDLATVNKKDLMNTLGNMFLRVLKYTYSNLANVVPLLNVAKYGELDRKIIQDFGALIFKYCNFMENCQIKSACHVVLEMGQVFNKYIQDSQFWSKKNVAQGRNLDIIALALRILEFYAIIMQPFIPSTTRQILHTLSLTSQTSIKLPKSIEPHTFFIQTMTNPEKIQQQNKRWSSLKLTKPQIFFEDIPDKLIQQYRKQYGVNQKKIKTDQENEETKKKDNEQKKKQRKEKKEKKKNQRKQKKQGQQKKQSNQEKDKENPKNN